MVKGRGMKKWLNNAKEFLSEKNLNKEAVKPIPDVNSHLQCPVLSRADWSQTANID